MAGIVAEKIFEMFVILLGGAVACKTGLLQKENNQQLSNFLLLLVCPLLIFVSYQIDFDAERLWGLFLALVASLLTFGLCILLSKLLIHRNNPQRSVEEMALVYSNCGFIGIPLISSVLGAEGVFYMTAYNAVFNLLLWTHGTAVMEDSCQLRNLWKKLLTPAIVAVLLGIVCFVAQIRLPEPLLSPLQQIANMNTPLAMVIAGVNLAQSNVLKSLKNLRLYRICFIKLLLIPALCLLVLLPMHLDFTIAYTIFVGAACPVGATAIMFAARYGKDSGYATELFVLTTILSCITIPLMSIPAIYLLR